MPVVVSSEFKLNRVDSAGRLSTEEAEEKIYGPRKIVRFVRRDDDVTVTLHVRGRATVAIVDSGAACSLVRKDLVAGVALEECRLRLVDAQSHRIAVCGKCVLDVSIGDQTVAQEFVVADIGSTILLGSDFLFRNRCVIDFCRMCLVVNGRSVPFDDPCCRRGANLCRVELCDGPQLAVAGQPLMGTSVAGRLCSQVTPCVDARCVNACAVCGAQVCVCVARPEPVCAKVVSSVAASEEERSLAPSSSVDVSCVSVRGSLECGVPRCHVQAASVCNSAEVVSCVPVRGCLECCVPRRENAAVCVENGMLVADCSVQNLSCASVCSCTVNTVLASDRAALRETCSESAAVHNCAVNNLLCINREFVERPIEVAPSIVSLCGADRAQSVVEPDLLVCSPTDTCARAEVRSDFDLSDGGCLSQVQEKSCRLINCDNLNTNGSGSERRQIVPSEQSFIAARASAEKSVPVERVEAIRELFDRSGLHLSSEEKEQLWLLLCDFHDVFSVGENDLGRTSLVKHSIDVGNARPIKLAPRRLPLAKKEIVDREIRHLLKNKLIQESYSPWAAPIVLVEQGEGLTRKTRLVVDYRKLNDVTRKDSFPMICAQGAFDNLSGSVYYSSLDLKSAFHQIELEPASRDKSAFCVENGLYEFCVCPYGLTNSPSSCLRLIDKVFRGVPRDQLVTFVDDLIVHAKTFEQELRNLRVVFARLRSAGLKLNIKKCVLFQLEAKFLGHVVSQAGIHTDPVKVEAVVTWPRPRSVTQVRSFVGLLTYYRRFLPGFSRIAKPLFDLTRKHVRFEWTDCHEAAFEELKRRLTTAPVLSLPDPEAEWILDTDASDHGIGAVLSQSINGSERVVAYFSRVLSKTEQKYCTTRKELLSIVKSLSHFHVYLYGRKFVVRTDHASLRWLLNFKDLEGQLARWVERLQMYNFSVLFRPGVLHTNADTLSRRPCSADTCTYCTRVELKAAEAEVLSGVETTGGTGSKGLVSVERIVAVDDEVEVELGECVGFKDCGPASLNCGDGSVYSECALPAVDLVRVEGIDLRAAQLEDGILGELLRSKEGGMSRPSWADVSAKSADYKVWWAEWNVLEVKEGVLCRKWIRDVDNHETWLPAIPKSLINEVLKLVHDGPAAGHFGRLKTLKRVKELYYWPQRRKAVVEWCRNCSVCSKRKGPASRLHGPMQLYQVGAPMERVGIDILGPLPLTDSGNRYLLVAMDYFTKWPEVVALPNQEAVTVATALVENFFCRFGAPLELHSDQGRNFESAVMAEVCKLFGVLKTRATPLFAQSSDLVERFNRTLMNSLSAVVSEHQRDWDQYVALVLLAYRCAEHSSTGVAPCLAMLGRQIRGPSELVISRPAEEVLGLGTLYAKGLRDRLGEVHDKVRRQLEMSGMDMKNRYDKKADSTGFEPGDAVWLFNPRVRRGRTPKLASPWAGPYRVMCKLTDVVYRVQLSQKSKPYTVNRFRLWRVSGQLPDGWWNGGSAVGAGSGASAATEIEEDGHVVDVTESDGPQLDGVSSPDPLSLDDPADPVPDMAATIPIVIDPVRTTRSGRRIRRPCRFLDR
jgi:hypothetical protein